MTDVNAALPPSAVVERYFEMWNETDPGRRRQVIEAAWTPDARYVDPLFSADGADGLEALVVGVHQQFPGHRFRLTGGIDVHHDRARWGWELCGPAGGPPVAAGVDFAVLGPDGRLREVTGFFEPPAPSS